MAPQLQVVFLQTQVRIASSTPALKPLGHSFYSTDPARSAAWWLRLGLQVVWVRAFECECVCARVEQFICLLLSMSIPLSACHCLCFCVIIFLCVCVLAEYASLEAWMRDEY